MFGHFAYAEACLPVVSSKLESVYTSGKVPTLSTVTRRSVVNMESIEDADITTDDSSLETDTSHSEDDVSSVSGSDAGAVAVVVSTSVAQVPVGNVVASK